MSSEGGGSVLVVDDDADWREIVADQLESAGFKVAVANDGFVAWTRFLRSEPLVVVTDIQMPVMDGRELLTRVHTRNRRVPVILVTASEALACAAEHAGAYAVIAKPTDPDRIIAAVRAAIEHQASRRPLARLWKAAGARPKPRNPLTSWLTDRRTSLAVAITLAALVATVMVARAPSVARRLARRRRWPT